MFVLSSMQNISALKVGGNYVFVKAFFPTSHIVSAQVY